MEWVCFPHLQSGERLCGRCKDVSGSLNGHLTTRWTRFWARVGPAEINNPGFHFPEQSTEGIAKFQRSQRAVSKVRKQGKERINSSN